MNKFRESIDKQIASNQDRNLFSSGNPPSFHFIEETINAIGRIEELSKNEEQVLIEYTVDKVLQTFYRINQYYYFDAAAREKLKAIYSHLLSSFREKTTPVKTIAQNHYENIMQWLRETNAFAEKIYNNHTMKVEDVPCFAYRAEMQIEILQLKVSQLKEPVLDIGCGKDAPLVTYLREKGIDATGFDRFPSKNENVLMSDWFTFSYGEKQWGTIISHLGFSNHFQHHHLREDGEFVAYAQKYMEILRSLKPGGSFHYAPDLPFVEQYLSADEYQVTTRQAGNSGFRVTVIKRLI
ncbi:hypothetical protein PbJCM13498_30470 [Prolixibacter bellariivorans]|uniref:Uncharacterized protein n=1 Tax=Prolixibacter bellariivorans TaxID=314319 RepID=A0A5M4B286_9BACT|nr:class I SAM-dependent methyltransferase [Prolixibacter bellariivorans]GET34184.1 hypothetical protein PbJCM13498_30470 [Prolixibacter bellariivorans]